MDIDRKERYIPVGGVPLGAAAAFVHPMQMRKMDEIIEAVENIEQPEVTTAAEGEVDGWADLAEVGFEFDDADDSIDAVEEDGLGPEAEAEVEVEVADFGGA